jgi:hypothetical protein
VRRVIQKGRLSERRHRAPVAIDTSASHGYDRYRR